MWSVASSEKLHVVENFHHLLFFVTFLLLLNVTETYHQATIEVYAYKAVMHYIMYSVFVVAGPHCKLICKDYNEKFLKFI